MTTRPIASAQVIREAIAKATKALRPRPVASASGKLATTPIEDRQHAGDQGGARGDRGQVGAVAGPAAEEVAVDVGGEAEDQRVQHDDVGHRHEGDDAAADLAAERRPPRGDLEEAVQGCRRGGLVVLTRCTRPEPGAQLDRAALPWTRGAPRRPARPRRWAPTRSPAPPTWWPTSSRSTSTASAPSPSARSCGWSASSRCCRSTAGSSEDGHTWWLWTCTAGGGLGLVGLEYCRRRRSARVGRRAEDHATGRGLDAGRLA